MIKTGIACLRVLFLAVVLSVSLILLASGCSGEKSGGTDPYGESSSSQSDSGKADDGQIEEGQELDENSKDNGADTEERNSLTQDESLKMITDRIKVPVYKVEALGDEFMASKQLPNKDNPEIIISEGEEAAQLTLTDQKGATVVLTFNIQGDIGDVETQEVEIAGATGVMSEQKSDKGDLIIYSWSVGSGENAIPYTLQLTGFSASDAEKLKNSLVGL